MFAARYFAARHLAREGRVAMEHDRHCPREALLPLGLGRRFARAGLLGGRLRAVRNARSETRVCVFFDNEEGGAAGEGSEKRFSGRFAGRFLYLARERPGLARHQRVDGLQVGRVGHQADVHLRAHYTATPR